MSKNNVTSDIVLQGQSNWELWIFVVKSIAEAGDVWEYVDPDQPHGPFHKPEQPVRPTPIINADRSPPTQPTQQALMQYNQDLSNYYKDIIGTRTRFVEDPEKAKKITAFETSDTKGILNKIREKTRRYKKHKNKDANKRAESDSIDIDADDQPTDQPIHEAYAVFSSAFNNQQTFHRYPLLHSWTLDPATDIHICNNPAEFQWKAPAADDDVVLAGGSEMSIEAWGEVTIPLSTRLSNKRARSSA
ncbi:hypothetical protein Ptr902_06061 [Pyrenophora tritici-repentis]|nr:hypothetical protein Ptr902_06061 [Pyrenophora tritici-repentis]